MHSGYYINYLEMENLIIIPKFVKDDDAEVIKQFENIFPGISKKNRHTN